MSTVIGAEALLPPDTQTQWSGGINFRPGDGTTPTCNPPRFSWQYNPDATTYETDTVVRHFTFEISASADMSSPVVSKTALTRPWYNFLEPLAEGTWYWRVGFCGVDNVVDEYGAVRSFIIESGTPEWDRSSLADESYLSGKSHPRILFNSSNRAALYSFLEANDGSLLIGDWSAVKSVAASATGAIWWTEDRMPTGGELDPGTWALKVAYVAMCYGITLDAASDFSTGLATQIGLVADYYISIGGQYADSVNDSAAAACRNCIAQGYDWAFSLLSSPQKAACVNCAALTAQVLLTATPISGQRQFSINPGVNIAGSAIDGGKLKLTVSTTAYMTEGEDVEVLSAEVPEYVGTWEVLTIHDATHVTLDLTYTFPTSQGKILPGPPTITDYWSAYKRSNSHGYYGMNSCINMLLAFYDADTDVRDAFDTVVDYMCGVTFPYGMEGTTNQGRGYGIDDLFSSGQLLKMHMATSTVFPEIGFNQNPFWQSITTWWEKWLPVAHYQVHEPWGDGDIGGLTGWGNISFGRNLALFMQSGSAQRHYINQLALAPYNGTRSNDGYDTLPFLYHWSAPAQSSRTPDVTLFPDGWVIGESVTPSTDAGYKTGLGFVFQARPSGGAGSHDDFSDGSYQMWAYGAPVTDAAGSYPGEYQHTGMAHYCLMVNGLSTAMPFGSPIEAYYSRFTAWKQGTGYTYFAADLTKAYPRQSFTPGGALVPGAFITAHSGAPLAGLVKVRRHVIIVEGKFVVIFTECQHGSAATFTDLYHVYPDTLTADFSNGKFSYVVQNLDGDDITVHVHHNTDPATLSFTDLTGTDVAKNPHTGEDYYAQYGDTHYRAHALWIENDSPATAFNFLAVIFPTEEGESAPTITRIDDRTVHVVHAGYGIDWTGSFDGSNVTADLVVNTGLPTVTITDPANNSTFTVNDTIDFTGEADDAEDGGLSADIEWSSDLDGALGTGATISVTLSLGTHVITASVEDSDTNTATDTITVIVTAAPEPERHFASRAPRRGMLI